MALSELDLQFLASHTRELMKQCSGKFKIVLSDSEALFNVVFPLVKAKAEKFYHKKNIDQLLSKGNTTDFATWLDQFIKAQIIIGSIQSLAKVDVKIPNINGESVKKLLIEYFVSNFTDIDPDISQYIIKKKVVNDTLSAYVEEYQNNPTGIFLFVTVDRPSKPEARKYLQQYGVDEQCIDMYSDIKHLGIKIGLANDYRPKVPAFQKGSKQILAEIPVLRPSDGLPRGIGYEWMFEMLSGYLDEEKPDSTEVSAVIQNITASIKLNKTYQSNIDEQKEGDSSPKDAALMDELIKHYSLGKPILLTSGWDGHSIGIGLIGNYLIYCNRGARTVHEKKVEGTLYIYELKSPLIKEQINMLMFSYRDKSTFSAVLEKFLGDPKKFKFSLYTKNQKRGNCVFSNIKSMIKAFIFIDAYRRSAITDDKKRYAEAILYATRNYKKITSYMRSAELKRIVSKLNVFKDQPLVKDRYMEVLTQILREHLDSEKEHKIAEPTLDLLSSQDRIQVMESLKKFEKGRRAFSEMPMFLTRYRNKMNASRSTPYPASSIPTTGFTPK